MFDLLARIATSRPKRVVGIAVVAALSPRAFGGNVAQELGPYGADDPRDDAVKSDEQLEAALGYDPAPALIAVVDDAEPHEGRARGPRPARPTPTSRCRPASTTRATARRCPRTAARSSSP